MVLTTHWLAANAVVCVGGSQPFICDNESGETPDKGTGLCEWT